MCCLDYAERPHPGNQLSLMLQQLVFLGVILSSHRICTCSHRIRIQGTPKKVPLFDQP